MSNLFLYYLTLLSEFCNSFIKGSVICLTYLTDIYSSLDKAIAIEESTFNYPFFLCKLFYWFPINYSTKNVINFDIYYSLTGLLTTIFTIKSSICLAAYSLFS